MVRKTKRKTQSRKGVKRKKRVVQRTFKERLALYARYTLNVLIIGGLFAVIASASWYVTSGRLNQFATRQTTSVVNYTAEVGMVVEHVYLEGQKYSDKDSVSSVMNFKIGDPILGIDLDTLRKNLESLPWVRYVVVDRQLPNTMHIRLVEYTPVALWQKDGKLHVIDNRGMRIDDDNLKRFSDFVTIIGDEAPYHIEQLLTLLNSEKELSKRVKTAKWIGNRRWDIALKNGIEVKLPEKSPEKSWHYLQSLHKEKHLLDKQIKYIDLRVPERVFIKPIVTPSVS